MLYFYVPKGTQVIGLHGGGHGEIHDSAGRPVFWLNGREANFLQRDRTERARWQAVANSLRPWPGASLDRFRLIFAHNAEELLLPREVVEADTD